MTTSGLYSDIVLPAATWYEKADMSSTDMHCFSTRSQLEGRGSGVEARTDLAHLKRLARTFSKLCVGHLGVEEDIMMSSPTTTPR